MSGLLNPPVEAAVCAKMVQATRQRLAAAERTLAATLLPPDRYARVFGQAEALREALAEQQDIYNKHFNI